jgi:hypothetical protein
MVFLDQVHCQTARSEEEWYVNVTVWYVIDGSLTIENLKALSSKIVFGLFAVACGFVVLQTC